MKFRLATMVWSMPVLLIVYANSVQALPFCKNKKKLAPLSSTRNGGAAYAALLGVTGSLSTAASSDLEQ